jgi:hypothetical protein
MKYLILLIALSACTGNIKDADRCKVVLVYDDGCMRIYQNPDGTTAYYTFNE